jgi:protein AFG1
LTYARESTWTPLPSSARKWEVAAAVMRSGSPTPTRPEPTRLVMMHENNDDFAEEAAYSGPVPRVERPEAPRLSEDHVWGVREDWGGRAKDWGKGARVYRSQSGENK